MEDLLTKIVSAYIFPEKILSFYSVCVTMAVRTMKEGVPMATKMPTIYDVAELAGVSIATVSRYMNGGTVGKTSRQKVQDAIASLDYHPAAGRTEDATGPADALALVVSDVDNPYYASLCAGAEAEARRNGFVLHLYCTRPGRPVDPELFQRILRHRADGAVLVGSVVEADAPQSLLPHLTMLRERMPLVTIGPAIPGLDCMSITSDLSVSVKKSLSYLTGLGHRRIAFIGGCGNERSASLRQRAFHDEMLRLGLETSAQELFSETGFTPQAGELCVAKLFSQPEGERPTALIAINDLVALGAMRQLQRLGLQVPQDVSVIGCDNQFFTPYLNPPLTTVDLHPADHGRCAVQELIAAQKGTAIPFSQVRECSLILRESCAPPRQL